MNSSFIRFLNYFTYETILKINDKLTIFTVKVIYNIPTKLVILSFGRGGRRDNNARILFKGQLEKLLSVSKNVGKSYQFNQLFTAFWMLYFSRNVP